MNGSPDILEIQLNIEWYLKKNYHGKIHAMKWGSLEDGTLHLLLYITEVPSVLVLTKDDLKDHIQEGWEARFEEKLESVIRNDK